MIIGIDFDNTIVIYDEVFHRHALADGLIEATVPVRKQAVRDAIRVSHDNEAWIVLQAKVYAQKMNEARVAAGFLQFLEWLKDAGHKAYIVSHKTEWPNRGPKISLRQVALDWKRAQGIVDGPHSPLTTADVFYEPDLDAKIARIATLGCTHFIDDLPELLAEPSFPSKTQRILYGSADVPDSGVRQMKSWVDFEGLFGSL